MVGHLTYRLYQEEDLLTLVRLWEEETNWGKITVEKWRQQFIDTPYGEASIAVATNADTGQILGQFIFIPYLVCVNGRDVLAFRPFAPIITKAARSFLSGAHPIIEMYWHGIKGLQARGGSLIYGIPDPRWLRFFRKFPFLIGGSFPLWSLPMPLAAPLPLDDGYTMRPLDVWDQRVDDLWKVASCLYGCQVVRNSRTLQWKMGRGNYTVTVIERQGKMVGLVASRYKDDRQWVICDLVVADSGDSLRNTLIAVTNVAHSEAITPDRQKSIIKVTVLVTPTMEPVVRRLGFVRDAYDFPFVVHILEPTISMDEVAPTRWYISDND
ncbi:hypothetical protein NDI43_06120 [Microcoleus vaginatus GB2-A3]|uniref:hypothetical protein n=1 Tax=Microcoleus vaginatus TaxID=119532 RepID=UPI0032A68B8B